MRVAVYAIALNEAGHVGRFLDSTRDADLRVVADTGSTDGTAEALQAGGAAVHRIAVRPWRFDVARNAALALVPGDVDVCVALDLDEVLNEGWRRALDAGWTTGATLGRYRYVTSHRPDGSAATEVLGAKIHARFGYRWRNLCHEALYADRIRERHVQLDGVQVDHWPDLGKSRGQYLPMLEAAVAEEPDNARHVFLLGREYVFLRRWRQGEAVLSRFLAMPGATWKAQRAGAMRRIARCRCEQDDLDGGAAWLLRACEEQPDGRDAWIDLADLYRRMERWDASYDAAVRALAIPRKAEALSNDPRSAGARVHNIASIAAFRLGRMAEALDQAEQAAALDPWDERLRRNAAALSSRGAAPSTT